MPELPEVERSRALIEELALGRRIAAVDDSDTYVCRPHAPGEIGAALEGRELIRERSGRGGAPLRARLMDQSVISGVGNLLADETLWRARLSPLHPAGELSQDQLDHLRRELRAALRAAIRNGGVHTGDVIP